MPALNEKLDQRLFALKGLVDETVCREFLKSSKSRTTFHRAFDVSSDWQACIQQIQSLGFDKLLTSGLERTAYEGRHVIAQLVSLSEQAKLANQHSVGVIAGAGVNSQNLADILDQTKCPEFHASCRVATPSQMLFKNASISMGSSENPLDDYYVRNTSRDRVSELVNIYRRCRGGL